MSRTPNYQTVIGSSVHNILELTLSLVTDSDKEPNLAALTLSFATRTQVVPEDGIDLKVNLVLDNATRHQAVKKFAQALFRNWNSFYVLQPAGFNLGRGPAEMDQEGMRERMAARMEALPPEQRARMEEMRSLSPEERRAQTLLIRSSWPNLGTCSGPRPNARSFRGLAALCTGEPLLYAARRRRGCSSRR